MNRSTVSTIPQESTKGELNNDFIEKYIKSQKEQVDEEERQTLETENRKGEGEGEGERKREVKDKTTKGEKGTVEKNRRPTTSKSMTTLLLKQNLINRIGDISEYSQLRKLSISFNGMDKNGLRNLDQLPHLRSLSAYCCGLRNFEDLADNKRLEKLHLQQNKIKELPYCLRQLQKIRHLRVDRNQIQQIEHLQGCTSLRTLDISSNCLDALDGVAGLQSLEELKANNNKIKSIKPLRALPSLREIQVDNNLLQNLDGLQNIPTLEVLHCNNNQITAFKIPQTYTHVGTVEKGTLKNVSSSSSSSSTTPSSNTSKTPKERSENTKLGLFHLTDIFMAGNKLSSLDGMERLGKL